MHQLFASRVPVMNLPRPCLGGHARLGQASCPIGPVTDTFDPTLNCQRDARGNTVCSDGRHFPPGCPHTPPDQYFSPGIAPDEVNGGILEAKIPAPASPRIDRRLRDRGGRHHRIERDRASGRRGRGRRGHLLFLLQVRR